MTPATMTTVTKGGPFSAKHVLSPWLATQDAVIDACHDVLEDLDDDDRARGAAVDDIVACARALNILSLAVDEALAAMDAAAERPSGLSEEGHRVRTALHNARAEALVICAATTTPTEAP